MNEVTTGFALSELAEEFSQFARAKIFVAAGNIFINSSPYEQEQTLIMEAVASRKREFYSGRYYARRALEQAGYVASPILRGEKGNPLWPLGVKGSITHDLQHAIAAVTCDKAIKGIGIDLIENPASVELHLQPLIASDAEVYLLRSAFPLMPPLALAFSLKESVVKAVSPGIDYYLDLLDIYLTFEDGGLIASLPNLNATLSCKIFKLKEGFVTLSLF